MPLCLGKDAPNLSPAVIARLTAEWQADYDAWRQRDLSARRYVYVWADGVYLQARMEDAAECMLVLIGATPEGKKELVGFQTGVRESAQSWRELLIDIKERGLEIAPDLAVGDGALGFWKAIEQVFPSTRHQRCWVHKTANVLNKVALSVQANMKTDLREIYGAPTRAAAEAAIDLFADKYGAKYEKAVACLSDPLSVGVEAPASVAVNWELPVAYPPWPPKYQPVHSKLGAVDVAVDCGAAISAPSARAANHIVAAASDDARNRDRMPLRHAIHHHAPAIQLPLC